MSKRQRDVDVTDHTIMCLFKGLYALSTTETLSTLARALGVALAAMLADVPGDTTITDADRAGDRDEERCPPMGLRDDGGPFLIEDVCRCVLPGLLSPARTPVDIDGCPCRRIGRYQSVSEEGHA